MGRQRAGGFQVPRKHRGGWVVALLGLGWLVGCSGGLAKTSLERTGPEVRRALPEGVANRVSDGVILCLDEERQNGGVHQWIIRDPHGDWLAFPSGRDQPEQHRMPASALETILQVRLPGLTRETSRQKHGRYTHWTAPDGAEIQVREIVTDQGWFASVERVRM